MDWKEFEDFLKSLLTDEMVSKERYFFIWKDLYKVKIENVEKKRAKQQKEDKARKHLLMQLWKKYWEYGKWSPNEANRK